MHRTRLALLAIVLGVASCSGDGGGDVTTRTGAPTITSPPSEIVPYCDAAIEFTIFLYEAISTIQQTPDAELPATARQLGASLQPLAAAALAEVPEDVAPQFQALAGAIDAMATAGDVAELRSPGVVDASEELHEFNSQSCGWPVIDLVVNRSGTIGGIPGQLAPGFTVFQIRNDAARERQVELYVDVADADSAVPPLTERFPADRPVEPQGVTLAVRSVIAPGAAATQLVDLEVGEYALVVAEPAPPSTRVRSFVAGSAVGLRVVEDG